MSNKTDRIIRFPELVQIVGRPRSSIYLMMRNGQFPAGRKIGTRAVGWLQSEIDAWLAGR
jgi:prophage regulatory protein